MYTGKIYRSQNQIIPKLQNVCNLEPYYTADITICLYKISLDSLLQIIIILLECLSHRIYQVDRRIPTIICSFAKILWKGI